MSPASEYLKAIFFCQGMRQGEGGIFGGYFFLVAMCHPGPPNRPIRLRACLHGGGGPQVGEVTRLGGVTRDMIGGVTRHILPHVPGVPHLHVNRP